MAVPNKEASAHEAARSLNRWLLDALDVVGSVGIVARAHAATVHCSASLMRQRSVARARRLSTLKLDHDLLGLRGIDHIQDLGDFLERHSHARTALAMPSRPRAGP